MACRWTPDEDVALHDTIEEVREPRTARTAHHGKSTHSMSAQQWKAVADRINEGPNVGGVPRTVQAVRNRFMRIVRAPSSATKHHSMRKDFEALNIAVAGTKTTFRR